MTKQKFEIGEIVFFNNKKYVIGSCHGLYDWDDKPLSLKIDWLQYRYSLYDEDDDFLSNPTEAFEPEIRRS